MDDRDVNPYHAPISGSRYDPDATIMTSTPRERTDEHRAPTVRKLLDEHYAEHQPRSGEDAAVRRDIAVRQFVAQSLGDLTGLSLSVDQGGENVTLRITGRT